ncbi:MAG: cobalt-zinc-cadmium efflux system membrane fusion protein [Chlamydiales bacterium]|jgi:cobalt-zinc-cadmium efflux system membrane fusion protein
MNTRPQAWSLLCGLLLLSCARSTDEHADHDDHREGSNAAHGDAGEHEEEHDDHDEGKHVELTQQQFMSAGIEVTVAQAGTVSETLTLPGTVAPNADAVLHVTPRVSGQARSVAKQLGESVSAGDLMCVIDSVELGDAVADFLSDRELLAAAQRTLERAHELYAGRLKALAKVLDGAIVIQKRIYEREEELQRKAVSTMRPLLEAERAFQMAKLEREKQLTELEAERDVRVLELEVDMRTKSINLTAATNRLRTLGLSATELESIDETSPLLSGEYRVHAPGDGVVVTRHVSPGEFVDAGAKLYIIENLSDVWFVASAFEEQLRSVRGGQLATVGLDAFPGTELKGSVSFVDYHVDPISRSVGVRITLDNQQLADWSEEFPLRPGMFGRARLEMTSRAAAVVLPEAALVHDDSGDYVFVRVEPFAFERRNVDVLHVAGGDVEVTSGLMAGETVAISGTFLLKSAERQGELGGGHSH